jgi:hypothetical protein
MSEGGNLTPLSKRAEILADLWMNYRDEEEFQDFIHYNDLALPLSYAVSQNIVKIQPVGETLIDESFVLLLSALEIPEDEGFDSLDDLFSI